MLLKACNTAVLFCNCLDLGGSDAALDFSGADWKTIFIKGGLYGAGVLGKELKLPAIVGEFKLERSLFLVDEMLGLAGVLKGVGHKAGKVGVFYGEALRNCYLETGLEAHLLTAVCINGKKLVDNLVVAKADSCHGF